MTAPTVRIDAVGATEARWAHATHHFRAVGYRFAFRTTDPALGQLLDDLYAGCVTDEQPETIYSILAEQTATGGPTIYVNDSEVSQRFHGSGVLRFLTWHVNRQVVERSSDYVLLHAGAVSASGAGVVMPAASEAGKTTLVAGLIRAGFQYVTDEIAAIDPRSLALIPYPKPLSIDDGSWDVLKEYAPPTNGVTAAYFGDQWQVNPQSLRADAVSESVAVSLVVLPVYREGSRTIVEPVRRAEAVLAMLRETFEFHKAGGRNLSVLARLLERVGCYRLQSGDLDQACAAVERLVEQESADV
jgi:hypothetical protein